jgi:hypothetical protein
MSRHPRASKICNVTKSSGDQDPGCIMTLVLIKKAEGVLLHDLWSKQLRTSPEEVNT